MAYENFNKLIDYYRKIQEADLFPIIAVSGPLGSGKSSFAIQCGVRYCERYLKEKYFSVKKYIAYDNQDVMTKYYNLPEYSPLIADEAARFAMGEDWNKAINKELKKVTAQIRPRHLLFFMNIPSFMWLDSKYRDEMVNLWVWIPTRGYAIVFQPDNNPGESDRWHLADFKKYKQIISQFTDIQRIYNLVSKHKCFFDMVKFPKVPEDLYQRYLDIRQEKTYREASENYLNQKDIAKIMLYNLKERWGTLTKEVEKGRFDRPTFRQIADVLFQDPTTKKQLMQYTTVRNWIQEVTAKLPVKPKFMLEDENNKDPRQAPF